MWIYRSYTLLVFLLIALKALVLISNPNKISASCCCCLVLGNSSHPLTLKKNRDGEQENISEAGCLKGQLERVDY